MAARVPLGFIGVGKFFFRVDEAPFDDADAGPYAMLVRLTTVR
jgi:hypothetical protein